ncbi:TPA: hypothetical protein QDZ34_000106 [Stenotrophomonas maltophilia]|nr:hypothetical protein [Stenotrophomonas maltophilia]HDS1024042.1 hypothetical protein [Stenotrophomonas maltophilia]HDS1029324.1 hypothetical protein [Stenotrophomonas maltophilia]HDS1032805.1 hypothetical protein [Stenotrophomonas maltophilia]
MTTTISRRAHAADMTMLVLFIALFPIMSTLHARVPSELYHVLAGLLLGGIAALSHALLHDGFVRWRYAGVAGIERSRSLRVLLLGMVYPALALVSGVIALVGTAPNVGLHYAIGFSAGGAVMGWRAKAALAHKRALGL